MPWTDDRPPEEAVYEEGPELTEEEAREFEDEEKHPPEAEGEEIEREEVRDG